ncbi:hypothetical protein L9F63_006478, partial [Diploptera punctata]
CFPKQLYPVVSFKVRMQDLRTATAGGELRAGGRIKANFGLRSVGGRAETCAFITQNAGNVVLPQLNRHYTDSSNVSGERGGHTPALITLSSNTSLIFLRHKIVVYLNRRCYS